MTRFARSTSVAACLAIATLLATTASARTSTARGAASPLQRDLDAVVTAGAPGVILFVRDGNRITRLSAGIGDIAHKAPMRPAHHFKIASLTKTYTATVVLQLVGEGKVGLDDTVQRWLPGVVPNGDGITIRQLLNHTSGPPDFEDSPRNLKPYQGGDFAYCWSPRQLVKIGGSQKPLFNPGSSWSYSNTNYV